MSEEVSSKGVSQDSIASLFFGGNERTQEGEHCWTPTWLIQPRCGRCGKTLPVAFGKIRCPAPSCGALNDVVKFPDGQVRP